MNKLKYFIVTLIFISCELENGDQVSSSKRERIPVPGKDYIAEKDEPKVDDNLVLYNYKSNFLKEKFGFDTCRFQVNAKFFRKEVGGEHFVIKPLFLDSVNPHYFSITTSYVEDGYLLSDFWEWSEYPYDTLPHDRREDPWYVAKGNQISNSDIIFQIE